jgi:iron complex outermembrane receptor protein
MKYNNRFNEQPALRFRQFTRKPWALFACLGRVVTISVLSVATLESASAATDDITTKVERADEDQPQKEVTLDDLEVTGSLAPLATGQGVRMVTVLSREDIQAAPVQSINDLVKMAVGVDVRQRGPIGAQTDIGIRGGTSEQIAILLNGVSICDPQTAHNAFDLPCDVQDIVRIEVLEGPAGRVYGTSSLAGAINIVTRQRQPLATDGYQDGRSIMARLEGGSFGYASAAARLALANTSVSTSYTRSDGYSRAKSGALNSDYEGFKVFCQGSYAPSAIISWQAGLSTKGFGSNTFYSAKYDEQYEQTTKLFAALQGDVTAGRLHVKPTAYWNHGRDRFELIRGTESKVPFNRHRTNVLGLTVNSYWDWLLGRTAVGAEFRNEDIVSTNLGEPLDRPFSHYKTGLNRSQLSFHAEHNILLRHLTLSAGLVAIKNTWNQTDFKLYPGADASLQLNKQWKVYASYNSSLRMPSFTELYYSVGGHQADKHLKPEEQRAIEAGMSYSSPHLTARAAVFRHHQRGTIDWVMDTRQADAVWQSVNLTKVNTTGVETTVSTSIGHLKGKNVHLPVVNGQVSYCYLHQQKDIDEHLQSRYSLEYLRHKVTAQLQAHLTSRLSMTVAYRFQDRTGSYTDTEGQVQHYKPYSVVDARLSWHVGKLTKTDATLGKGTTLYVEANNLTDSHYVDYGNVRQPGCWVIGGVHVNLDL